MKMKMKTIKKPAWTPPAANHPSIEEVENEVNEFLRLNGTPAGYRPVIRHLRDEEFGTKEMFTFANNDFTSPMMMLGLVVNVLKTEGVIQDPFVMFGLNDCAFSFDLIVPENRILLINALREKKG